MDTLATDYRSVFNNYWNKVGISVLDREHQLQADVRQVCASIGYGTVLDIGSGDGRFVQALCKIGLDATGVDVSDSAVSIAENLCPGRFMRSCVLDLRLTDNSFDIVTCINVLEFINECDVPSVLAYLARVARRAVLLRVSISDTSPSLPLKTVKSRKWWEECCFKAGMRRHPNLFEVAPYHDTSDSSEITLLLEPVPTGLPSAFGLSSLLEERNLHMDMALEAGSRSDAHMLRYFMAANHVRPGDRVLDAACGLGYGSRILSERTLCESVLGVDSSTFAIEYASVHYSEGVKVRFSLGTLPEFFKTLEPGSFDFIASFETLEHLENPLEFLSQCQRILSPGGRIMLSVPNDWTEEDGKDPNPYHFQVYDWDKFLKQVSGFFLVEKAFCQTADRLKRKGSWINHGRQWREVPVEQAVKAESEWCLALAMTDPVDAIQPFLDRHHSKRPQAETPQVLNFQQQYSNPWLVPSIVAIGLRTESEKVRLDIVTRVNDKNGGLGDLAASLCVEGYVLLGRDISGSDYDSWSSRVSNFTERSDWEDASAIEVRWGISLFYLLALIQRKLGYLDDATTSFEKLLGIPFAKYSPLIATKVVDAYYELGISAWIKGKENDAREFFLGGLHAAKEAVTSNWDENFGSLKQMPRFAVSELSQILDHATRCCVALEHVGKRKPFGVVISNVVWNSKFQISSQRFELERSRLEFEINAKLADERNNKIIEAQLSEIARLNSVIQDYEIGRKSWYEPQLLSLREEVEHLRVDLAQFYRDKCEWYDPHIASLHAELERLQSQLNDEKSKLEKYNLAAEDMNKVLEDGKPIEKQYYIVKLAERDARIGHLEEELNLLKGRGEVI